MKYIQLVFVTFILMFATIAFSQTLNIAKKAYVGGMHGFVYNDIWGYTDDDNKEYAIIGSSQAINIYDVTDCANPILKMAHVDGSTVSWRDFKVYRNYGYGVCDGSSCTEGLEIINLDNYTVTQNTNDFQRAHNIYIDTMHARLYVVGSDAVNGEITIYTLDTEVVNGVSYNGTPANPVLLTKFATTYIHDIHVKDHVAYASHGQTHPSTNPTNNKVWDVSDPSDIVLLKSDGVLTGYNHSSWTTDDSHYAYVAEEFPRGRPISIYDMSGTNIQRVGFFKEPLEEPVKSNNRPHNPFVKGDTLFISYYEDGVQVFDISNPLYPKRIAYYDTYPFQNGLGYDSIVHNWKGAWGVYPYLPSGCILASDITQGLFTFKLDIPVSDGINLGQVTALENTDLIFANSNRGVVLRSPKGYCFRLFLNSMGLINTERIICHKYGDPQTNIEKSDIAFNNTNNGIILKRTDGNCMKIKISASGVLFTQSTNCNQPINAVRLMTGDLVVETPTKGVILKDDQGFCHRVTVDDYGFLNVLKLISCP